MTTREVENEINSFIKEKLFGAMRRIIISKNKDIFTKTSEYQNSQNKKTLLDDYYKKWFESTNKFYLSLKSIYALHPLVERELKIIDFSSEEVVRVKADYSYNGCDFSAYIPAHYNKDMQKEIQDCISDLKVQGAAHIVDNYIEKKDSESSPHEPLTTAQLKYSAYYLFKFEPSYVSMLANKLFNAGLITDPETNGWHIEDRVIEEMITILNQKYGEEKVLQHKRRFTDQKVDREPQDAIRPTKITSAFFPKNIICTSEFLNISFENGKDKANALKLYEFIFYITLATQMRNSIYDTSKIEIVVGKRKLTEQANVIIDGQDNWELLVGELVKRIASNESGFEKQTVVLPEIMPGEVLKPIDVYAYAYNSKRPPRYGIGRFITQILEKYNIGTNKEQDEIVEELVSTKAVIIIKSMLHPQENSIRLIKWLEEHLPSFLDLDFLEGLKEKIELVRENKLTLQSVLEELNETIEFALNKSGYIKQDDTPSVHKVNKLKAVAIKNNLRLGEDIFKSSVKIDMLLAQYPDVEYKKIGNCPNCNSIVHQKEFIDKMTGEINSYFACEKFKRNGGCNFSLWDSYIYNFFSSKSVEMHTVDERAEVLIKILPKKKGYFFSGLIAKNKKPYDARIYLDQSVNPKTGLKQWGFALSFVNKKEGKK